MNAAGPEGIDLSLTTTDRERRRQVNGIVDSYSHSCDVLAELLQNAVDAIRMHVREHGEAVRDTHEIRITVDVPSRSIRITDTGVGFLSESFKYALPNRD